MLLPRQPISSPPAHDPSTPLVRVADDEPSIQDLFVSMAALGGFTPQPHLTAKSLLDTLDETRPGCLVLDLILPDATGIEVLQELAKRECKLPVVFVSGMARVSEAVSALKLGSVDFIEKPFEVQDMLTVIRRAIELDAGNRRNELDQGQLRSRFDKLSPREREVMEQVVQGAANKEVAAVLGLSPKTVEVHRANVMRKTNAQSLAELVRMRLAVH